jgi:hypothetical protein
MKYIITNLIQNLHQNLNSYIRLGEEIKLIYR